MVGPGKRRASPHTCGEMLREGKDRKEGIFESVNHFLPRAERPFDLTFRAPLMLDGNGHA